jgi:hypothetical protein
MPVGSNSLARYVPTVLVAIWAIGVTTSQTMGGAIHLFLLAAAAFAYMTRGHWRRIR